MEEQHIPKPKGEETRKMLDAKGIKSPPLQRRVRIDKRTVIFVSHDDKRTDQEIISTFVNRKPRKKTKKGDV